MKKSAFAIILAVVCGVALGFFSCGEKDDDNDETPTATGTTTGETTTTDGDTPPATASGQLVLDLTANCGDDPCI